VQARAFFHTMNTSPGTVGSDPVILATAGYDHTVRFWQAHSGICTRTVQHQDSQVNALEITPDRSMIAAAGYQHIRMYDLSSNNPNPIISYDGVNKNIASWASMRTAAGCTRVGRTARPGSGTSGERACGGASSVQ